MSYIGVQPTAGQYRQLDDISGSFNGATVTFTTSVGGLNVTAGSAEQLLVSLGGVIQNPGADYSVSTNSITFTTAPGSGLDFFAILMGDAVNVGTPADGSVTSVKLASDLTVDLASGSAGTPSLTFDANTGLFSPGADEVAVSVGGSEAYRIDSSGRLLVGTSSARTNFFGASQSALFQSESNVAATGQINTFTFNEATTGGPYLVLAKTRSSSIGGTTIVNNGDQIGAISFQGTDGTAPIEGARIQAFSDGTPGANDMPGRLVFSTTADGASSPTERMRILSFGLTRVYSDESCWTWRSAAAAGTTYLFTEARHSATGIESGGTVSFRVYTNGNVQNTNNSFSAISDIKLKENIVDANSQWDDIKALQVRNYNLKEGQTHTQIGLIAQEVEPISPGLVYESPDFDSDGNDLGTVTKSVNYSVLYMKAVKALQEAMERIEQLETSNADLLARVTALEAQ